MVMVISMDTSWITGIGPWALGGTAVGAGIIKLLTIGSTKRKDDSREADSLFNRATKLVDILQDRIDKLTENEKRSDELVDKLRCQLENCDKERSELRTSLSTFAKVVNRNLGDRND